MTVATLPNIQSFAAPTPKELAAFSALPAARQRELVISELSRSLQGETIPLTEAMSKAMFARAMSRVADQYEAD